MRDEEKMNDGEKLKVCPLSSDTGKLSVIRIIKRDSGVEFVPVIKCLWCGEGLKNV